MTDKSFVKYVSMSDKAISKQIGKFIRYHRLAQNKTQDTLAVEAGISRSTLSLLERGEPVTLPTFIQVLRVLDQLQVMSIFEIHETLSPLALAKLQKQQRQRARRRKSKKKDEVDW